MLITSFGLQIRTSLYLVNFRSQFETVSEEFFIAILLTYAIFAVD